MLHQRIEHASNAPTASLKIIFTNYNIINIKRVFEMNINSLIKTRFVAKTKIIKPRESIQSRSKVHKRNLQKKNEISKERQKKHRQHQPKNLPKESRIQRIHFQSPQVKPTKKNEISIEDKNTTNTNADQPKNLPDLCPLVSVHRVLLFRIIWKLFFKATI